MLFLKIVVICLLWRNVVGDGYTETSEELDKVEKMIQAAGYTSERHIVVTEDGYILTLHRIPSKSSETISNKGIVLVQHGIFSSSADWVVIGENKALAFALSDAGYDVWLGNNRGNQYARMHTSLDPEKDSKRFWNFSWDEMGRYDLPATIDYILNATAEKNLSFVGYSQGSTAFFVMLSEKPEYNSKVKSMQALAPIAYLSHVRSPLFRLAAFFQDIIFFIAEILNINNTDLRTKVQGIFCPINVLTEIICYDSMFPMVGFDVMQRNTTALSAIFENFPDVTSMKDLHHYAQLIRSGKFCKYDNGAFKNKVRYGVHKPPNYNLDNVRSPVALHYADNDWLADTKDVEILTPKLPNLIGKFKVPYRKWNHMDYLWAIDADEFVYAKIIDILNSFHN